MTMKTWEELVCEEPYLLLLENHCRRAQSNLPDDWCANRFWQEEIDPQLVILVGCCSDNERLRHRAAFDLAYNHLYALLPRCHEGCTCM
jgi:hypothetical protein